MKKILTALFCLSFTFPVFANTCLNTDWWSPSRLSVGAYGGYGNASGGYKQDGQFTQARLALALRVAEYNVLAFAVETGVQSGNSMRLAASNALIAATGGLPIQSNLKPLLDILVTVKGSIFPQYPLFGILKAGIAYRQMTFEDRSSARDGLRKVNGELQAGLAYEITSHATLTVFYQGIYSDANAGLHINNVGDITVSRIPTQQAGFLGFEYSL